MNRTVDPIWSVQERDTAAEQALASELGAPMLLAMALVQRSITDAESADHFLNPKIDDFHDPALLPDYELAAKEILGPGSAASGSSSMAITTWTASQPRRSWGGFSKRSDAEWTSTYPTG